MFVKKHPKRLKRVTTERWRQLNSPSRVCLVLLLGGLAVRSLPYLVPVHARDLAQDDKAITFIDRNGLRLGTLLTRDQDHTAVVALDAVSPHFIQAILSAEDQRFYQHGALDLRAVARSLLEAIQARQIVSGASTITMQLARMVDPSPRTLVGKLQEVWLAWRLAAGMSKDEVLQAYINRLPMGGNIYGVEAAARVYFGSGAADLTLAQASLLAALPNNPSHLSPYDNWERLKRRQAYVLGRMVEDGSITPAQADRAHRVEVTLKPHQQGILAAPHFLFWLAAQLPEQHPSRVRTTLDRSLQRYAEAQVQAITRMLAAENAHHAAVLVLDNQTGEVLAYVGSPDYFAGARLGRNDGVQALRQPGSTLKPFLYALALEKRTIRPNTILADVPTNYPIPGAQLYSPIDYSETFQGPVRVRIALANSLNVPAVRVLEQVGVGAFLKRLRTLGFEHLNQSPEYYGLGLTLGSGEVSIWELSRAYLTLARRGQIIPLKFQLSFEAPQTNPVAPQSPLGEPSAWTLITDMLSDRHARAQAFGVESVLNLPFPAAVKTGTSSDFRDTWTVGFTTDYTVATWVGNFSGDRMHQVSGIAGAAPLWQRLMLYLHAQQEPTVFPPPTGLIQQPICALTGQKPTATCPAVVQEYFYPEDLLAYGQSAEPASETMSANAAAHPSPNRFHLPTEYDEWLRRQPDSPLAPGLLRIVSPRTGDYFLLASTVPGADSPAGLQRLEFKLAGQPTQPVEWWLNGQWLGTASTRSFFWPLQPGNWQLEVRSGDQRDRVSFAVAMAAPQPVQRGFSTVVDQR